MHKRRMNMPLGLLEIVPVPPGTSPSHSLDLSRTERCRLLAVFGRFPHAPPQPAAGVEDKTLRRRPR